MAVSGVPDYLSYLSHQKRFSPLTVRNYAIDLAQFAEFIGLPEVPAAEITHRHIRSFMAGLIEAGKSAATVNRKLSSLRSYFRYLVKQGQIGNNPTQKVRAPKIPRRLPVFIDESRLGTDFSKRDVASFKERRDCLMLEILYQTGIRRAELIGIRETDVDLSECQLRVQGKRNKQRVVPFSRELGRSLELYMEAKKNEGLKCESLLVHPSKDLPLSPAQVTRTIGRLLAGLTTGTKRSPHVLRHTFATHMLNQGADINAVKELLGHASLASTQVYTHNTIDKLKRSYNQAHPRSGH